MMKDDVITNTLYWRQEFASQLLDEIESDLTIDTDWINRYCENQRKIAFKTFDSRQMTFAFMALKVQKRLSRGSIDSVIKYLEMLEDCFSDLYPISLN